MIIQFKEARDTILRHVSSLGSERVSLFDAVGRVLAEDVYAPWGMPQWDNSAMDGYAVRVADCQEPATLAVTAFLPAGGTAEGLTVQAGTAIKIMTGAPIPSGCDAIVPFEETEERGDLVKILGPVKTSDHIRFKDEDVQAGQLVIPSGTQLRPPEISMLASFGHAFVSAYRRPRVAILSTGDELVELGQSIGPGQIVNSNSLSLAASVKEAGGIPVLLGIARDNHQSHLEKLSEGLKADALITSAGVSAGDRDLVREVLAELGMRQIFWKVNIKPGRPTAFGIKGETPVFCLPGNPVSTMMTFETFVRPALLRMQGQTDVIKPTVKVRLLEPARKKLGRVQFLRVQLRNNGNGLEASSSGDQNTGILRTLVRADGIAVLPAERGDIATGEDVEVMLLG